MKLNNIWIEILLKSHGHSFFTAQSHQRQLSLKASEIQERLIKNKTLLNVVEPTLENHSLEVLLGILQRRIELDKEVLFQFTQLKKEIKLLTAKNSSNSSSSSTGVGSSKSDPSVAPLLMRFQRGCQQVSTVLYIIHNIGSVELQCPQFWREIEKNRQIAAS
jgi:nucleoside-triphosphatase THEP1